MVKPIKIPQIRNLNPPKAERPVITSFFIAKLKIPAISSIILNLTKLRRLQLIVTTIFLLGFCTLPLQVLAGTFTAFGPKTFIRGTGKPVVEIVTFSIRNPNTIYTMLIYNGGIGSELSRVSSAIIKLNDITILDTSDFNQQVSLIQKQVSVAKTNQLEVELRSIPDSGLTIVLEGIDNDPPIITASVDPPPNTFGWHNHDVMVTFHCEDTTSDIATCPNPVIVNTEGAAQKISGTAVDKAGNTASASVTINIDKTRPVINITSPQHGATINNPKPLITVEYSDILSGIDTSTVRLTVDEVDVSNNVIITEEGITYTPEIPLKDGEHTVAASTSDKAGNVSEISSSFTAKTKQRPFIFPEPGFDAGSYKELYYTVYNRSVEVCDVNRDGILDAVIVNGVSYAGWSNKSRVSVILGKGDGSFGASVSFAEKSGSWGNNSIMDIALDDFNNDNYPDIAVTRRSPNELYIFLGNGDGTFFQRVTYSINTAGVISTGNFNGDEYVDIALPDANRILVFAGNGDGSFGAPLGSLINSNYSWIADISPEDFNGDGITDIAVIMGKYYAVGEELFVLVGNGDGTFQSSLVLLQDDDSWLSSLTPEDYDGDGYLDILIARQERFSLIPKLILLIGDGSGGFPIRNDYETNHVIPLSSYSLYGHRSVKAKDLNGDQRLDILLSSSEKVFTLLGKGDGTFEDPMEFNVSGWSFNTGDFDNDGAEDIVTAGEHLFFILFGRGDGAFIDRKELTTKADSSSISLADFDGDNTPDIARAGSGRGVLFSTILNKGNHWSEDNADPFQGSNVYRVGAVPSSVKMGDLNRDGHLDVVTASELSGDVSVLLNNGKGGLGKTVSYTVGREPGFVTMEDLNKDGYLDIITANKGSNDISILLGKGDGIFHVQKTYAVGPTPSSLAIGDFNGDGNPDIAVANSDWSSNYVSILIGNGDGTFKPQAIHTLDGRQPVSIQKGDFNNDGHLDLVVLTSQITLLLGKGDGKFVNKTASFLPTSMKGIVAPAEDLNRDGILDLIGINGVFLGDGDGRFQRSQIIYSDTPGIAALGDLNNDGDTDLLLPDANSLAIWLGQGDGTFKKDASIGGQYAISMDIGDINGDGIMDIAVVDYENLSIIPGNGKGTFPGETVSIEGSWYSGINLTTADFNGDNNQDIAVSMYPSNWWGMPAGNTKIALYWGTDRNTFTQGTILETSSSWGGKVYTDDLNEDGLPDIMLAQHPWGGKAILTFLNNGGGTFKVASSYNIGPTRWYPIFEDVNKDGHLDIVTIEEKTISYGNYSYSIVTHTGKGDGTFQYFQTVSLGFEPGDITGQDFNGDGFTDLAVSHGNIVAIYINNGNGTFGSSTIYEIGTSTIIGVGSLISDDFNQDGKMDLVASASFRGGAFALLIGDGDGTFKSHQYYGVDYWGFGDMVSEDFNLDGRQDIAIAYGNSTGFFDLIFNALSPLRTPPSPPRWLAGKAGDRTVTLTWTANPETDIAGYNSYRSLSPGGRYVKINNSPVTSLSYADNTVTNGITYYYTVSAIDIEGDESSYAMKVKVTPNPPDTIPPVVKITNPADGKTIITPLLFVSGTINEIDARVKVNGISGTVHKQSSTFTAYDIPLSVGENIITVTATDHAGNFSSDVVKIIYTPYAIITGVIKDALTGNPVQYAYGYVTDAEKTQSFTTGADGGYYITKLVPGEITIRVDASNYQTFNSAKTLSPGETLNLDIVLELYPATLKGGVYNDYTYQGIAGTTVTVTDRKKTQTVTTNSWGGYEVTNIVPYDVTITVSKEGYETFTEKKTLTNRWTNWRYYYLKRLPPSTPTRLTATSGAGYVRLAWNQNSEEDIKGYNIYRSTTSGTGYIKLYTTTSPYYKDTTVTQGSTYYYVITAVNTSQKESSYSAEAQVAYIEQKVSSPTGLTAKAGIGYVELTWNPNQEDDISGYKIYRSTTSGTGYTYITTTSGTYYKDTSVTSGTVYYYVVTAVNTLLKESDYSNEVSATPEEQKISVAITSPANGEKTDRQSITVTGVITTKSPEVGVVIEVSGQSGTGRYIAQINGSNFAAIVNLQEGTNTIKAIATDTDGNKAEASITVNATIGQERVRLTANPNSGILTTKADGTDSFETTLEVDVSLTNPVANYSWDFNGDGIEEAAGTVPKITALYQYVGLYYPTVTITDTSGNQYQATTIVNVLSKEELDALLKGKWEGMKGALADKDISNALNYFSEESKQLYNDILTALYEQLPQITQEMQGIQLIYIQNNTAKYRIRKNELYGGQTLTITYYIYFVIDTDGIWKIMRY